jgi:hypothetical protein
LVNDRLENIAESLYQQDFNIPEHYQVLITVEYWIEPDLNQTLSFFNRGAV